ncbi:MAG: myo-inositol-1(or 4)-monophosphatase [Candidatus Tokpelaia sp. JSC188]|nr:MAG: myo-inositol-1(or 4)-monophosphatase [Candidatus Tokpelaia sp. JSC188]
MLENNRALEDDLLLLSRTAQEAGRIAMRHFGQTLKVWIKTGNSPVCEADLAVDAFLKHRLLSTRPDYGWVSEETSDERAIQSFHRFFIVDPIDGTRGFLEGKIEWCISIAIVENGHPIVGVLECPVKNEHYLAQKGKPALLNGNVIQVSFPLIRKKPVISCCSSMIRKLPRTFVDCVTLKTDIPSLAYRLALLSRGCLDAVFIHAGCHDWDIAAADIILKQTGGIIVGLEEQSVLYLRSPFCHDFLIAGRNQNIKNMLNIVCKANLG